MTYYPPAPPPPPPAQRQPWVSGPPPAALRPVVALLMVNLLLSLGTTIAMLVTRHSIIEFQLDHRHITDPQQRAALRDSYSTSIVVRAISYVVVGVVYFFLVRALLRGKRWAYRRVIWLSAVGIVGLVVLLVTPYPMWLHVEQVVQAVVLACLLYFVLRPDVRAHCSDPARRFSGRRR